MKKDDKPLKVLIVDDEINACINLKNFFTKHASKEISVAGIANSTVEAAELISQTKPDAVFIDIDMPAENAFEFLQRIAPFSFEVIFVTAYDQYAVKAFRLNAVDYILKPIDIDELILAVAKLSERINLKNIKDINVSYLDLLSQIQKKTESHKIRLKSVNGSELVDFKDIYFVEAQGGYSRIVFSKEGTMCEVLMSNTLSEYEDVFPLELFYRIHKKYLVNCMHISKFTTDDNSFVTLKNQFTIPVSRRRVMPMKKFLKSNNYFS